MRYHFTPVGMVIIKKTRNNKIGEDVGKGEPLYAVSVNLICTATMESSIEVPQKIKNRTTI